MKRLDNKEIPNNKEEVRLFMVGIDANHLIPHVFKHYFDIGVDRIFYIDNNSTDRSREILSEYENVHVWLQKDIFDPHKVKCGAKWIEELLGEYGIGNWCLLVDTDELFIYPDYENRSIRDFVATQEEQGYDCVSSRTIDMYSHLTVGETYIKDSLLETCPFYDRSEYGCRRRVLGFKPLYTKIPLVKFDRGMVIESGFHNIRGYKKKSNVVCGILHFKFISNLSNFISRHGDKMPDAGVKNKIYGDLQDVFFYHHEKSFRYVGSEDLEVLNRLFPLGSKNRLNFIKDILIKPFLFLMWISPFAKFTPVIRKSIEMKYQEIYKRVKMKIKKYDKKIYIPYVAMKIKVRKYIRKLYLFKRRIIKRLVVIVRYKIISIHRVLRTGLFKKREKNTSERVALVCIAKDEDNYIEEWIAYNLKLGFDKIIIYANDWGFESTNDKVEVHHVEGKAQQLKVYNSFIKKNHKLYDWAAFFDVDEFLCLKKHPDIKSFLEDYPYSDSIAINWVFFGDNGLKKRDEEKGVLRRFTKRGKMSKIIKSIVKMKKNVRFREDGPNPHSPSNVISNDTNNHPLKKEAVNPKGEIGVAQINHYFCKTFEEYINIKISRGRATMQLTRRETDDIYELFETRNQNIIEDTLARDFLYKTRG